MKDLYVPIPSEQSIDISEIDVDFLGLIIAYKENKAIGYIQYYDGFWYLNDSTHWESSTFYEDTLIKLITVLIEKNICDHFKVIEFSIFNENS